MRSWSYYIQIKAISKGKEEEASALYIVALPNDENILKNVEMECYASEYVPGDIAIKYGRAYAIGTDLKIQNLEKYNLLGYREDLDLYIFNENVSFEEGLINLYQLLIEDLLQRMDIDHIQPIVDVGTPPEYVMISCLKKALERIS